MTKYLRRLALLAAMAVSPVCANGILQCSFNSGAFVTAGCYSTTAFVATNDFLDWGAPSPSGFGQATIAGNTHDINTSPWTTNTNNGGVTVGITQNSSPTPGTVERFDNYGFFPDGSGGWTNTPLPAMSVNGRFNSLDGSGASYFPFPTATNPVNGQYNSVATPYYGDHLIGYQASLANSLILTFSQPVYAVGFRASARSDSQATIAGAGTPLAGQSVQDLTVRAYNTISPSVPFLSYELQDTGGYGTCTNAVVRNVYTACNDAPYIGIDSSNALFTSSPLQTLPGTPWITSIQITSTDPNGFYLDELFIQDTAPDTSTPEPGTTMLVSGGFSLAAILAKFRRA